MMNTYARPVRDLRNNYNEILDLVEGGNKVIITKNGRESAVVIGAELYRDVELFLHKQYIKRELAAADAEARNPDTKWLSESEFWDDFEATL